MRGGPGDDIVIDRAEYADIDCGDGTDVVYVKGTTVPTRVRNCESVIQMG